jgi:hypothetical protein
MGTAMCAQDMPQVNSDRGRWYVTVPWDRAENLRSRLARRGLPATLCLDPEGRVARLELWPGVSPDRVVAELTGTGSPSAA